MAFSSVQFLFVFLPLSLAVYWVCPRRLRNLVLDMFSLLFFAWAGLKGAAILVLLICINWLGGLWLGQLPKFFQHLCTVVVLWGTLIIFGAPGLKEGLAVLRGIMSWQTGSKGYTLAAFADTKLLLILAASFLLCGPLQALLPKLKAALYARKAPSLPGMAGLLALLFFGLMRVMAGSYSAFSYFQL